MIDSSTRRRDLAGTALLVTGVETALGYALARRLAAEVVPLVLAAPDGPAARRAMIEVTRVRQLHRRPAVPFLPADTATPEGSAAAVAAASEHLGGLDAVLAVVPSEVMSRSEPDVLPWPLIEQATAALERRPGGRLVLAADVPRRGQSRSVDAAFTALVQHLARVMYVRGVCVNGVLVAAEPPVAERLRAFESGSRADATRDASHSAAASAAELLLTFAGASLTGQVLRIGRPPAMPSVPLPELGSRPPLPSAAR